MSFQAYLDTIQAKTGKKPEDFLQLARARGLSGPQAKAGDVVSWLAEDFGLGRGHAMALVHVIKNGEKIDAKHVGTGTTHSDASDTLWLDGKLNRPE